MNVRRGWGESDEHARLQDLPSLLPGGIEPETDSHLHFSERLLFGLAERRAAGKLRDDGDEPLVLVTEKITIA